MMSQKTPVWQLLDGVAIARTIESVAKLHGYYVALGGSVLYRGQSFDDLDIIIYEHHGAFHNRLTRAELIEKIKAHGIVYSPEKYEGPSFHTIEEEEQHCYPCDYEGRRIDIIFTR